MRYFLIEYIFFVLQKGIDVDAVDDLGNTPIAYAAMNDHERFEFVGPLISLVHSQNKLLA